MTLGHLTTLTLHPCLCFDLRDTVMQMAYLRLLFRGKLPCLLQSDMHGIQPCNQRLQLIQPLQR